LNRPGAIPKKYTGEDQNISSPLTWMGPSDGTKKIPLICDGPDAPRAEPSVHWVMYKIPANPTGLSKEKTVPTGQASLKQKPA
jgi:phosphatidylethanolamine-binding protein (PEBP) family uncharacterized protein